MGFASTANLIKNPSELLERIGLKPAQINDITIDVIQIESPTFDFEVTEHPVETGLNISDTRIEKPITLAIDCILTDAEIDAVGVVKRALNTSLDSLFTTWQDKKDALYTLKDSQELVTVQTEFDIYENMMITSLRPIREVNNTRALFVHIELQEVRIVSSEINLIDESLIPDEIKDDVEKKSENKKANNKQKKQSSKGKQQTKEATPQEKSILRSITDGLGITG